MWGNRSVPVTPAYSRDSDTTTFTASELNNITEIWQRVAEAYSPFNINVTTVDPGNRSDLVTVAAIIGGSGAWTGQSVGGIAYNSSFYLSAFPNVVYIFEDKLKSGDPKIVSLATAHEVGHSLGLSHQSTYNGSTLVDEYNPGDSQRAPLMGIAYNSARGVWWKGQTSTGAGFRQDDLAVVSHPSGFGYRPDDHGNDTHGATPIALDGFSASAAGIIEQMTDADYFSFSTTGGTASFTVNVAPYGAMLDATAEIRDANNNLVVVQDTTSLGETISANLAAGTYYLVIKSHGTYGDLGQYTITGTVSSDVSVAPEANAGGPYTVAEGGTISLDGTTSTGQNLTYAWDLDGDGIFGETGDDALRGDENGATPTFRVLGLDGPSTYTVSLTVTDGSGNVATSTVTIHLINVAPTLSISGLAVTKQNASYTLTLSSFDLGIDTISKWLIHWGDGTSEEIADGRTSIPHVYTTRGQYIITAQALDDDGTYQANSIDVTVQSAYPIASSDPASLSTRGSSTYQFTVTYFDDLGVNAVTLDDDDILVTGPHDFRQLATLVSATANAGTCTVIYRVTAPGGLWDISDNGTYVLTLQANQVGNFAGDLAPSSTLGSFAVSIPALPVAKAGGPYTVAEGRSLQLNALSSTGNSLSYAWDLDGDGIFGETGAAAAHGDETGATPTFRATDLDGPATYSVNLKVTDSAKNTSTVAVNVSITNAPPTLLISGASSAKQYSTYTLNLSATDPGIDTVSQWILNWGDGTSEQIIDRRMSVTHVYNTRGLYKIAACAVDDDGTYQANNLNVTVRSPFPNAVANITPITTAGEAAYSFTIIYSDDWGVDAATLDDNDLQITGPNGFGQLATFVSAMPNGNTCIATYSITASGGIWDQSDNGTYTLSLQDGQVRNTLGDAAPAAVLANFQVNIAALPAASVGGPYTTAEGGTVQLDGSYSTGTELSYAWDLDGDGVFGEIGAAAIHGDETGATPLFHATGLDGPSTYPIALTVTDSSNNISTATTNVSIINVAPTLLISGAALSKQDSTYTLNLSATDPGIDAISKWIILWGDGTSEEIVGGRTSVPHTYTTRGQYTIAASVIDDDGAYPADDLTVTVTSPFPKASAAVTNIAVAGSSDYRFTVIYTDDVGLDDATLDSNDILVTGPNGFSQLAELVSTTIDSGTNTCTVVYRITAPDRNWDSTDNGTYSLDLQDDEVGNIVGDTAPTSNLASFDVAVPQTDITPPTTIVNAKGLTRGGATQYTFSITYRDDVALDSNALDGNEITVRGPNRFRQTATLVTKKPSADGKACTVTYRITAPGGIWDPADNGDYWFQLRANQVMDVAANAVPAGALNNIFSVNIADDGAGTTLRQAKSLKLPAPTKSRTQPGFLIGNNTEDYYWFAVSMQIRVSASLSNMVGDARIQILNKTGRVVQPIRKYLGNPHAFSNILAPGIYYIRVSRIGAPDTGYDLTVASSLVTLAPTAAAPIASLFSTRPVVATAPTPSRSTLQLPINRTTHPITFLGTHELTF